MKLHKEDAGVFIPDCKPADEALERITHLGIGAHQDDLEIMAAHGILECLHDRRRWFGGVVCTSGGSSPRGGPYAAYSDDAIRRIRRREQDTAASIGGYGVMIQLGYESSELQNPSGGALEEDLGIILRAAHPSVVYTHNPADKHDTHVAVTMAVIRTIRAMPRGERPQALYGCEVWRDLDWLDDMDKIVLDVSAHESLAAALLGVHDSQIAGGKRYDLAVVGRRRANATFHDARDTDTATQLSFAMDLTPLVHNDSLAVADYVATLVDNFRKDVVRRIQKLGG